MTAVLHWKGHPTDLHSSPPTLIQNYPDPGLCLVPCGCEGPFLALGTKMSTLQLCEMHPLDTLPPGEGHLWLHSSQQGEKPLLHPSGQEICLFSRSFIALCWLSLPVKICCSNTLCRGCSAACFSGSQGCSPGALACCRMAQRGQATVHASVSLSGEVSLCGL